MMSNFEDIHIDNRKSALTKELKADNSREPMNAK